MDIDKSTMVKPVRMPSWLLSLLPLLLLGLLAWVFSLTNPLVVVYCQLAARRAGLGRTRRAFQRRFRVASAE